MNSTDYQVQLLQERVRELETRMLQLEDRVVFNPPVQPQQEPAFHGFMDEENCTVNLCFTPWAPGGPNNELPTAYYTQPPAQQKPLTDDKIGQDPIFRAGVRFAEAKHNIGKRT